ncbi:hypothetical protein [Enterococcus sp. DIV0802b]|uniref:hypothetical protein n=1 Tax=Enterococcus sp. DIV0802b TaxID=2774704 RepID=UPI003D2FD947
MERWFEEAQLQVIELPIEWQENRPVYRDFIRELPTIQGEGTSRQAVYRQLAEAYAAYLAQLREVNEAQEEMTSSLLSTEELLRYYDGETFDGFELPSDE